MKAVLEGLIDSIRLELSRRKLDGLIVQTPVSSLYVSRFPCSNSIIQITKKHCQFFTDFRYIVNAIATISHMEVVQMQQQSLVDIAVRV